MTRLLTGLYCLLCTANLFPASLQNLDQLELRMGLVLSRAINAGEVLAEADLTRATITNPALARNVLVDPAVAKGQVMKTNAPAGAWLRTFMIRPPYLVRANQLVKVHVSGQNFAIQSDGIAVHHAALNEQISVRMPSKRIIRGQVQADGSIAVK